MCKEHNSNKNTLLQDQYTLTRFLYPLDEAKLSFLHSLLNKTDIQECYFWIFEIHYSGFAVWPLLWQIYLDFYKERSVKNVFENYLFKKMKKASAGTEDDDKVNAIASIVRNLFRLIPSPTVFYLRHYILSKGAATIQPSKLFTKAEKNEFITLYSDKPKKYHILLHSLYNQCWLNVCSYLIHFLKSETNSSSFPTLLSLFTNTVFPLHKIAYIELNDPLHYLLALSCASLFAKNEISNINDKKMLFIRPTINDLQILSEMNAALPLSKYGSSQVYNTLKIKRLFSIDDRIGCFVLQRYSLNDMQISSIIQHWEYYASSAPLWQRRLLTHLGSIDDEKKELIFPSDDLKEAFYELYGYEFDEQPKEIVDMSHRNIPIISLAEWHSLFFADAISNNSIQDLLFPLYENVCINY